MLRADIEPLAQAAHVNGAILKVILETALLSDDDILFASSCCWEFGADFIKTSTGMLKGENSGASIHAVHLMEASRREIESASRDNRSEIRTRGIKASGGIRDRATALAMIEAGATRIGTSSGAAIVGNKISDSINTY
jgi:deoxyribose-phosphate aldolase